VRDRQRFQEAGVCVRRVARGAGLEPLLQIGGTVHNPPPQLAIDRPIAVEPELGERAFGQPDHTRGFGRANNPVTPSLAFYNGTPYVAYLDANGYLQPSVQKYTGTSWVFVGNENFGPGSVSASSPAYLSLAIDQTNGQPYVAFVDTTNGNKASVMTYY